MLLTPVQNRALFKLAVDLVKADDQIHYEEMTTLHQLQQQCNIQTEEIELIHYITIQDAIETLSTLQIEEKNQIIEILSNIVSVDNDIDYRENLMLGAIKLSLQHPNQFKIISTQDASIDCDFHQMVYLEHEQCTPTRTFFEDPYHNMMLTNALAKSQIQLFYLPRILEQIRSNYITSESFLKTLQQSINYIVPSLNTTGLDRLNFALQQMDVVGFTKLVETQLHIHPGTINMNAFLMIMVQDSSTFDDDNICHRNRDFLCIDVTREPKTLIALFVEHMQQNLLAISYHGYYRILFDFLNSRTPIMSTILLKRNYNFILQDIDQLEVVFKSAPQAKTFYLLLLFYAKRGLPQALCEMAQLLCEDLQQQNMVDVVELKQYLLQHKSEQATLIYNTIIIYETIANKNSEPDRMLEYVRSILCHRSSLKNYINSAFALVEELANKELYLVKYNKDTDSYLLQLSHTWVRVIDDQTAIPITESKLWKKLANPAQSSIL